MPNYTYKADVPNDACVTCRDGIVRYESLRAKPMVVCVQCGRMVHRAIVPATAPTLGATDPRLDPEPLYMSQLVKPGDPNPRANPDNYVSGPHSWRRKVDQAQREGVRIVKPSEDLGDASPREIRRTEREERNYG